MDLYLIGSKYVGTQADARAEAKAQGVRFDPAKHGERVDTSKAGLIAYLNEHLPAPVAPERSVVAPPPVAAERPLSAANVLAKMDAFQAVPDSQKLTVLEEAIQNANGFQLASLIGNVMSRLEELRRDAKLAA